MESNIITLQEIFAFEQLGVNEQDGRVKGRFVSKGVFPKFIERFKAASVPIPYDIFDPDKTFEV
jgi:pilus assembly protein CpaF